ncbi:MAG: hypothetical protein KAI39_10765 [Desulfobulbaceae bacterium]|nr:hypothetical protein [Desulfobulbaceae bacterium]
MNNQLLILSGLLFLSFGCSTHHYTSENHDSVSLYLRLPDASHVQFASSMDTYQLHETHKNGFGFWQINILLTPESSYFYIVDDAVYIPDCRFKETDDFGSQNCLYMP